MRFSHAAGFRKQDQIIDKFADSGRILAFIVR